MKGALALKNYFSLVFFIYQIEMLSWASGNIGKSDFVSEGGTRKNRIVVASKYVDTTTS